MLHAADNSAFESTNEIKPEGRMESHPQEDSLSVITKSSVCTEIIL